jgi:ketosteroid isomerase-like protein
MFNHTHFTGSRLSHLLVFAGILALMGCQQAVDYDAMYGPITDAYVAAWNAGDLDALNDLVTPTFQRHVATNPPTFRTTQDLDDLKEYITERRAAVPDFRVEVREEIYLEDMAIVKWSIKGTLVATGIPYRTDGVSVSRVENGRIAEEDVYFDQLHVALQQGATLIPPEPVEN